MLTEKESLFAREYIINKGNAYQAALKSGYAKTTAENATEWLNARTNSDKKRHLPYKKELVEAIQKEREKIESSKSADAKEIVEYLTSVVRKTSVSEELVIEQTGDGTSRARTFDRHPTEKESLDAAKQLSRILGIDTKNVNVAATAPFVIRDDVHE